MDDLNKLDSFVRADKEVDNIIKEAGKNMVRLAKVLYEIKSKELWKEGGYKDFTYYVETKKELGKSYASQLVHICELGLLPKVEAGEIGWNKAYTIIPVLKRLPQDKREEVIELAETTPLKELRNELIVQGYYKEKTDSGIPVSSISFEGNKEEIEFIKKATEEISLAKGITKTEAIIECLEMYYETEKGDVVVEKNGKINKLSRQFSDMFLEKHLQYRKAKYLFRGARDKKLCDKLVATFTLQELEKAVDKFFTKRGEGKWWKDYNLGAFYTAVNSLVGEDVKIPDKYDAIMEKARKEAEMDEEV